jgi:hypothetical protein
MNALYAVPWTSPNGQVEGVDTVAARSETEATQVVMDHETRGGDGYGIGNAWLIGDLAADHPYKYAATAVYIGFRALKEAT